MKITAMLYRRSAEKFASEDAFQKEFAIGLRDISRDLVACCEGPDGEIVARPLEAEEYKNFIPMGAIEIDHEEATALLALIPAQESANHSMDRIWHRRLRFIAQRIPV